jgi:hypothetical protein
MSLIYIDYKIWKLNNKSKKQVLLKLTSKNGV